MENKFPIVVFLFFLIIGIISGYLAWSTNLLLSWVFIGLWIDYSLKFLEKRRQTQEFGSQYNTPFYTLTPLFIAVFYNFWGYYTRIWNDNILVGSYFYLSLWNICFALPYLLFSFKVIHSCFKKYDVAYIYKAKSVKARTYGYFCTLLLIILGIITLLVIWQYADSIPFTLIHSSIDFLLLTSIVIAFVLLIGPGIFGKGPSLPRLSTAYLSRRRKAVDRVSRTPIRTTSRTTSPRTTSPRTTSRSTARTRPRGTRTQRTTKTYSSSKTKAKTKTSQRRPSQKVKSAGKINLAQYKPKAGVLSLEDFKCIFCFQLPKLPDDERRGIVLCPKCKHPAHADEFRDWLKSSKLCSRCDAQLPSSYFRNPKIIPVRTYVQVIRAYTKGKK